MDCLRDYLQCRDGAKFDRAEISIQRIHARTLAGDNFHHGAIEFIPLADGISASTRTVLENGGSS